MELDYLYFCAKVPEILPFYLLSSFSQTVPPPFWFSSNVELDLTHWCLTSFSFLFQPLQFQQHTKITLTVPNSSDSGVYSQLYFWPHSPHFPECSQFYSWNLVTWNPKPVLSGGVTWSGFPNISWDKIRQKGKQLLFFWVMTARFVFNLGYKCKKTYGICNTHTWISKTVFLNLPLSSPNSWFLTHPLASAEPPHNAAHCRNHGS